jgi:DNA-binding NarL/FixJ family response regulator
MLINIAIIEDHQVLVDALNYLIRSESDLNFVGGAGSLAEGRELIKQANPDVLLLDVGLPDGNGLDLISEIKKSSPNTQVVVLTRYSDESTLMRAIDSGVSGFLPKGCTLPELMNALRKAANGEIIMPPSLLVGLLKRIPRDRAVVTEDENIREHLTPRERDILTHLARGKSVSAIAEELSISTLTVRTHIRNLLSKLGVHSRLEAVAYAIRNGLIDPIA